MRRLIAILLLVLVPSLAFGQTAAPSVTITPPKIETTGVTMKQVAIVVGAMVAGAVLGEAIIGELLGEAVGTLIGVAAGYVIGTHVYDEMGEEDWY